MIMWKTLHHIGKLSQSSRIMPKMCKISQWRQKKSKFIIILNKLWDFFSYFKNDNDWIENSASTRSANKKALWMLRQRKFSGKTYCAFVRNSFFSNQEDGQQNSKRSTWCFIALVNLWYSISYYINNASFNHGKLLLNEKFIFFGLTFM